MTICAYIAFLVVGSLLSLFVYVLACNRDNLSPEQIHKCIGASFTLFFLLGFITHFIVHATGLHAIVFN